MEDRQSCNFRRYRERADGKASVACSARTTEGILCRSRPRRRHRRTGAPGLWPARLRSPRNRPQQACGRQSAREGRSLRRRHRRNSQGRHHGLQRPWRLPQGGERSGRPRSAGDRRDLSAGEQGTQRNETLRTPGLRDRPDRTPRTSGGRGDDGAGVRCGAPGVERGRRRQAGSHPVGEACLRHANDAERRRYPRDHRGVEGAVPGNPGPRCEGHLLRDPEPPDRGAAAGKPVRRHSGDRRRLQLELQPAAGRSARRPEPRAT